MPSLYARVAESVDATDLKSVGGNSVEVQVLSRAPIYSSMAQLAGATIKIIKRVINMSLKELKTTPTCVLINSLFEAYENEEQGLVNIYAYELTTRIWVPNEKTSFTDMLKEFGYKRIEEKSNGLSK